MIKRYLQQNWKYNYPSSVVEYLFTPCPRGLRLVNFVFQKIFRINGDYAFMVHFTTTINGKVTFGKDVARYFANCGGCYFQGINGIEIGDNSIFAPGVKIISANHDLSDFAQHTYLNTPVRIGSNCWLGANVVILPGVEIGDNVIIGAGSIVTKSFGDNLIIAGNPAKIVRVIS